MLDFSRISHTYDQDGRQVETIRQFDLSVSKGEFLTILGPSGCGKSTLLHMAAGFLQPTVGEVSFRGTPVSKPGRDRSLVFQSAALMPWLSVGANIALALPKGLESDAIDEIVAHVLDVAGLQGFDDAMPHQLSIGMRQKVAIARALAMDSQVLLMDEPFASLDEQTRLRLNRDLVDIWRKERKTIVFVTHSIQEALVLSTRIVLLSARPACMIGQWRLPEDDLDGLDRQKARMEDVNMRMLSSEILHKMELCCPPKEGTGMCECMGVRHA